LSLLWDVFKCGDFNTNNTFIIDDLDDVYKSQRCNSIPVLPPFDVFEKNMDGDEFLKKLMSKIENINSQKSECLTGCCHT